ncbi:2-hydroxy-3-oxopropionate reductase [Alicyclobacillus cellulosilyticus]|uniref:2-hydroxy-3-oxopropionate reductase n=1 Tax=Alicyclobacillus cellulosilyticus TaxID=1003997 RepID=A0A917KBQ1_9BACL|nr:NAD(P)-dependent oxidoreductase [Alicyclobacillus cellulosilyticus]GGJ08314.1 2-hydroxy-3-oxopropionate reductase [Alicyclobacillus cellulosilyticus]
MRVGWLGLGAMGLPMARRVLQAGHELFITAHRNRSPLEELARAGATVCDNVADVVARAEVVCSILPADAEMEAVWGDTKVRQAFAPGAVLVEMTSGSPSVMKRIAAALAQQGVAVLDAPVSGGTAGAAGGTLTVMAGGDPAVLARVRPVLDCVAAQIHHVGGIGSGKAVKAINQMLAGIHMLAAAEALSLAQRCGMDLAVLQRVIAASSGQSWIFDHKAQDILKRAAKPGFRLRLMKKDLQIAVDEGRGLPLPLATLALQWYELAARDAGDLDFSAVGRLVLGD